MTVVYAHKLATASGFGRGFLNLLFLWKGSVYKLIWRNLLVWLLLYYAISVWYRFFMQPEEKRYCEKYSSLIPLSFVLGFYVNLVVGRWWQMWDSLPWPDNIALFVTTSIQGQDERSRLMRRTIMRYVNLASVHSMAMFSTRVRKRFPTLEHFVGAGLLNENERGILEELSTKIKKLYFVPLVWASQIITKAREEGKIKSDLQWKSCMDHMVIFRQKCGRSLHIDVINVPLVYSQVVTLAVYTFFLACLLGRQFIQNDKYVMDLYFPIFTVLQFLFYLGWLKVAETLVNPYGEDDDDFEMNWLIDRHLKTSYMIVDEMNDSFPELVKDVYWETVIPEDLPHTEESQEAEDGRETPDLLGSMLDVPSSFDSAIGGDWSPLKQRPSTIRRLMSIRSRFSVRGQGRPSSRTSNGSQPLHLTPIRERKAMTTNEKPNVRRTYSSPPTSPDGIVIVGASNLSSSVGASSGDAKPKPKRQASLIDRFRFGSSSPKLGAKKFRGPPASPSARRKYLSHDDGVDMLPTVVEAPAFVEAAAQAIAVKSSAAASHQLLTPSQASPSAPRSDPIKIPALPRTSDVRVHVISESAPAAPRSTFLGELGTVQAGHGEGPSSYLSVDTFPSITPQISIHEEPVEVATGAGERRDSGGPVSSDDDGEFKMLVANSPKN